MKTKRFYATGEDLIALLNAVERNQSLTYTLMGNFLRSELEDGLPVMNTGAAIPDLGKANAESSTACDSYLVVRSKVPIQLRIAGKEGERVCVDQLANPDSVTFTPGGIWNEGEVLEGRVGTVSDSRESLELMKSFQAALRQCFIKVRSLHVGPKALSLLQSGTRLTVAVQSPRTTDLTIPDEDPV